MIVITIPDDELRLSLTGFLAFKVPGVVAAHDSKLHVIVRGELSEEAQCRLVKRLVWAWKVEHNIRESSTPVLSVLPSPDSIQAIPALRNT